MPLFNISFEFNSETKTIDKLTCTEKEISKAIVKAKAKAATIKVAAVSLVGSTLQLTQEVVDALGVEVGDKVLITVDKNSVMLTESSKGNVLSKKLTITCKGKNQEAIQAISDQFTFDKKDDILYLKPITNKDNGDADLFTDVNTEEIDKSVVEELGDAMDDFDFDFEF